MFRIAFHSNQLGLRGTETSLFDYAFWNRAILLNDSIIVAPKHGRHDGRAVERFGKHFRVLLYDDIEHLDRILADEKCAALYCQKFGRNDGLVSKRVPTLVHCVFDLSEPHGTIYASISPWLSTLFGGQFPSVPYIVDLPAVASDLRGEAGIPPSAVVFGRHGGFETFDYLPAIEAVRRIAETHPEKHFLFLNTAAFSELPNIHYLPGTADTVRKAQFINSCDAMIHGRVDGETFGSACAEFALRGKPIFTNAECRFSSHIDALGDTCITYRSAGELARLLGDFERRYEAPAPYIIESNPVSVMKAFERVFLAPLRLVPRRAAVDRGYVRQLGMGLWALKQDAFSQTLLRGEVWEPHILSLAERLLQPGDCFIDAGAALGYHSLHAAGLVGPTGRVYSFEPQTAFFELLCSNIERNRAGAVRPFKYALFDKSGAAHMQSVDFSRPGVNVADASLSLHDAGERVACLSLDELSIPETVTLMKIDVQGAELGLLKGAARLIERDRPYLIMEFEEHCLRRFGLGSADLFNHVRSLDYVPIFVSYRYPSDHVCVPAEKLQAFREAFRAELRPLKESNALNFNKENGVTEELALLPD